MLKRWMISVTTVLSDPRRRALLRAVLLALALLSGWLLPHHYALADGYLIPGGHGA